LEAEQADDDPLPTAGRSIESEVRLHRAG
jgi:hypothetical protein